MIAHDTKWRNFCARTINGRSLTHSTTKPATEEEKISSPDTNISDRTPEEVSERSSDVGSVKTEETDTTVKKLEKTTTSSVVEVPKEKPSKTNVEVEPEGWGSGASRNLDFVSA